MSMLAFTTMGGGTLLRGLLTLRALPGPAEIVGRAASQYRIEVTGRLGAGSGG